jgi:hypothetical protein
MRERWAPGNKVVGAVSLVLSYGNASSRTQPAGRWRNIPQAPGNPRKARVRKPCSCGKSPAIPAYPGSTMTSLSRRSRGFESRRSRRKYPANRHLLLSTLAQSTAGCPTGHALIPHANPTRSGHVKRCKSPCSWLSTGQSPRSSRADPASESAGGPRSSTGGQFDRLSTSASRSERPCSHRWALFERGFSWRGDPLAQRDADGPSDTR